MSHIIRAKHIVMFIFSVQDFLACRGVGFCYLFAVVSIMAAGAGARVALQPILDARLAYLTFYPAVMLAALFGGLGPGLLATALSALLVAIWREPLGHPLIYDLTGWVGLAAFFVSGSLISVICEALRHARRQAMETDAREKPNGERLRGEQALRESEERVRYILKHNPNSIAVLDREMRYLMVSDRFLKDYRLAEKDVIGKSHYELFPEIPERWRQVHQRCLTGNVERSEDDPFPRADGSVDYVRWECRPWYGGQSGVGGIIIYTEVMTERKRAEVALRERERQLSTLVANLPGVAYRCKNDLNWTTEFVSERIAELTGYTAEEFIAGRIHLAQLIHPDDVDGVWKAVQLAVSERRSFQLEYRIRHADGAERWVWEQGQGVWDATGQLLALEGFVQDITERKLAEAALRESEEKFRLMAESANAVVGIVQGKRFVYANPFFERLSGYNLEEILAREFVDFVHPDFRVQVARNAYNRQMGLPAPEHYEFKMVTRQGEEHWIDLTLGRIEYQHRPAIVGIGYDITVRKRAEAQVHQSEQRLCLALKAGRMGTFLHDFRRGVTNIDERECELFGLDPARREWPISAGLQVIHPKDRDLLQEQMDAAMSEGTGHYVEFRVIMPNGSTRWLCGMGRPVGPDEPDQMVGVTFDITDRKRAEEEARQQREWLQVTLTSIGDGVITCDPWGRVTFLNPVAQNLTGWELTEAQGQPIPTIFNVINEQTRQPAGDVVGRVLREKNIIGLQNHTVLVTRAGREIPIEDSAAPILDSEGIVAGVVLVFHDVTQRRRAHEALVEREERLNLALASGRMGLWEWDLRTNCLVWNDREYEILGLPIGSGEVRDELFFSHVHPEDRPELERSLPRVVREDRDWAHEFRIIRADGQERWLAAVGRVLRDAQGQSLRMIGVNYDITERKLAEAELQQVNDQLRESDRRKDEFLAMLAHELRNPLAPIRNAVQVLRLGGLGDPRMQRQREIIDRQVAHMAHLLDDLLDVSRITRGIVNLKNQSLNLMDVLNRAVETASPLIEERHQQLTFSPPAEELRVSGDLDRLIQIVGNLLNNAAKYTEPGGRIWLTAACEGAEAVIRVRDTGVGIAPELLPQVFDVFTQAERSLDRSQGGLGLGLTLVRSLVQMHGGTVEAHSAGLGLGSEFIVRLPALPEAKTTALSEQSIGQETKAAHRILVVDDVMDTANSLTELLSLLGHQVRAAYDGHAALSAAREFRPDVILLDIGLPGMDGFEVARRIRRDPALEGVLLLALTGYSKEEDRQQAQRAGFDRLLTKPVDFDALQSLLA